MNDKKHLSEDLAPAVSMPGETHLGNVHTEDAVFGTITEDGPNYRNVGWIAAAALMVKTQIGLGVLSIPAAFDTLGLIPGVICLLIVAAVTTWSNYMVGVFKINHPEIYGIDDAGKLMFGRIGREVLGAVFALYLIFAAGAGILSISIALNSVSTHATCTAVFVAVAAITAMLMASVRTMSRISWFAWAGSVSIFVALTVAVIAVGVQDRPDDAPQEGPWKSDYKLVGNPSFREAASAVSTFVFAYAGTSFFFPVVAEMREPRHYNKSLTLCQSLVTIAYVTVGIVVYYFCGSYVASPALGSAGKKIKIVAYAIALPGLCATATLSTHVVSKYFFVRILRGSKHLVSNSLIHWSTWLGCVFTVVLISYCIASGIPVFSGLASLIGALLGTLLCFQPYGCMWLYDNWAKGKEERSPRWIMMVCWSVFVIVSGSFIMVSGTYGSIVDIMTILRADNTAGPWSCADNSNSV